MKRSSAVYLRTYRQFAGVDLVSAPGNVDRRRFSRLLNMWRDYHGGAGDAVETAPGYRRLHRFAGKINGLYHQTAAGRDYLLVHAGTSLYRVPFSDRDRPLTLAALSPVGTLADRESHGIALADQVYLSDGTGFYRVSGSGTLSAVNKTTGLAYAPVTHRNGEALEARNLLTDRCRHRFTMDDLSLREDHTEGLCYTVTDEDAREVAVSLPPEHAADTAIVIPAQIEKGGRVYTVTKVADRGFSGNTALVSVSLPATLRTVGNRAFLGCTSLASVTLPDNVTTVEANAFYGCTSLAEVTVGTGLALSGTGAFANTPFLTDVYYTGDEAAFSAIVFRGLQGLSREGLTLTCNAAGSETRAGVFFYPVYLPARQILSVTVSGFSVGTASTLLFGAHLRWELVSDEGRITGIRLYTDDRNALAGRELEMTFDAAPSVFLETAAPDLLCTDVIAGCTEMALYDGRLFFSGNPALPDTVLYSARAEDGHADPTYVGVLNYWREGDGGEVRALLSAGKTLFVLKGDTVSEGAVYYHTPKATGDPLLPEIYPATEGSAGVGCAGAAIHFFDDPVFLSRHGVFAVDKQTVSLEKSVSRRSSRIDPALNGEDLRRAKAAVFCGYLVILAGGKLFLGDGRQVSSVLGHPEYEWYYWDAVGSYTDDAPRWFYTETVPDVPGLSVTLTAAPDPGAPVAGTVYSETAENGDCVYYVRQTENGETRCFPVDTDGERTGGDFSPATHLLSASGLLFFGTADGSLSLFSTDKRGQALYRECRAPEDVSCTVNGTAVSLSAGNGFHTEDELCPCTLTSGETQTQALIFRDGSRAVLCVPHLAAETNRIPRFYYTHQDHAYPSGFSLAADDCGFPGVAKDTEPRSLVIRAMRAPSSAFSVYCRTDRHPWRLTEQHTSGGTDDTDFASFDFRRDDAVLIPCREKERGYAEKQLQCCSERFRSPFGIYEISFRYRVGGRIATPGKESI